MVFASHLIFAFPSTARSPKQGFMFNLGNNRDGSPPLNLHVGYSPAKTNSFDFLLALQAFLGQNQIDFIGPFRIQIETTSNNIRRLVVVGETHRSDWNGPDQLGMGVASSSIPSPPEDFPADEAAVVWPSITSGSPESFNISGEFIYS